MSVGSEFHRSDAATGKERRPTVVSRNGGTSSCSDDEERSRWRPELFDILPRRSEPTNGIANRAVSCVSGFVYLCVHSSNGMSYQHQSWNTLQMLPMVAASRTRQQALILQKDSAMPRHYTASCNRKRPTAETGATVTWVAS